MNSLENTEKDYFECFAFGGEGVAGTFVGGKKMKWSEIKRIVMKARYIIGGLILASIPRELEQTRFILSLGKQTFWHGLVTGIFLAIRIIGVCVFAYGIAYYAEKTAIVKDEEKTDKDD